ncbi:MAG TPA: hypothetical protein VNY51_09395 [Candidatus Dormibacteraeota bacterium]|nr:hypothetical protein [Candidatus Dormibacteraeota bacterium]
MFQFAIGQRAVTLCNWIVTKLTSWRMFVGERLTRKSRKTSTKGVAGYHAIGFCVVFGIVAALLVARSSPKYPIEIHHHVTVWRPVLGQHNAWWISSDEPEPNRLPLMRWNCCPDYDCSKNIAPGWVIATFKYEERGTCKSIRGNGLGAFWADQEGHFQEAGTWAAEY